MKGFGNSLRPRTFLSPGSLLYSVPFPESVNVELYKKDKDGKKIDKKIVPIARVSIHLKIPESLRKIWKLSRTLRVLMINVDLGFAYQRLTCVQSGWS